MRMAPNVDADEQRWLLNRLSVKAQDRYFASRLDNLYKLTHGVAAIPQSGSGNIPVNFAGCYMTHFMPGIFQ